MVDSISEIITSQTLIKVDYVEKYPRPFKSIYCRNLKN